MRNKIKYALAALALVVLAAVSPMKAQAAGGLELYTDYPGISVEAGDSQSISMYVSNDSGSAVEASLNILSMPEGWEGYFQGGDNLNSRVHIDAGAAELDSDTDLVTFNLTLPEEVEEGVYTVELKADAGAGDTDTLELEITVNEQETGQSNFTAEYPEQQGASGTSFSFDATIVNNRGTEQSYSLSAEAPSGWTVSFTPSGESSQVASVSVEARGSLGMTVDITPPESVEQGEYTIPCTAVSASDTLDMELIVTITGTYGVSLSTPTGNLSLDAYANAEESVTLSITNTGNVDLSNLNLTSSAPTDWEVEFDESTIETLEAGATQEVTAHITPTSDAMTGDYVTTITVSNDEVSSDAEFRVSVETRTSWGIFAAAIIVVLLIGLRVVFKKYGRR